LGSSPSGSLIDDHWSTPEVGRHPKQEAVMRRIGLILGGAALAVAAVVAPVAAAGPPSVGIYIDGDPYRTLGTPTDFSMTGADSETYDPIYALGNGLASVAVAAPGDPGFNGGRWAVFTVTWIDEPYQIVSYEELLQAEIDGKLTIADSPSTFFECPVIPAD
jgi:hypothetical protein